jgi:taurine dioxygenase
MRTSDLEIRALAAPFGAEVLGLDLREELPDSEKQRLRDAWAKYGVLVFHQEDLSDDDLDRLALIFGEMSYEGIAEKTDTAHRQFISNVLAGHEATGNGELLFHMGYSFAEHPLRCTMLYGCELPPPEAGGDTLFANAHLAYKALPPALRAKVDRLKIVHTKPQDSNATWAHPIAFPHPVTGETVLFCSPRHFTGIVGLEQPEAQALCDELAGYISDPSHVYRHVWRVGDIVLWDNIKLQHARTDFDPKYRRHLKRRQMGSPGGIPA